MKKNRKKNLPHFGFVGTGLMGGPMVQRLLGAGYPVTVWNRTPKKMKALEKAGAYAADGPRTVASKAKIIMMCLTDSKAVKSVVFGTNGISSVKGTNKILVDFSSIKPKTTVDFAQRLERESGIKWIDAPVSGGVNGAKDGTLAILAGGEEKEIKRVRPILSELSNRITHMGTIGSGQITKLCNQVIVGSNIASIAEAINLATQSGINANLLAEALGGGFADSVPLQIFGPRFASRQYEPLTGHIYTMLKDLKTALELGKENTTQLPITSRVVGLMNKAKEKGWSEKDITKLIELFD